MTTIQVIKGQSDPQLTGQLVSFYNRIKQRAGERGEEIRGNNIVNVNAQGSEVETTGYGEVIEDPIQGAYILHPNMTNLSQEDKDELIGLINPVLTIDLNFTPTPEEEI